MLFPENGEEKKGAYWKINLPVLWLGVFFAASSYTSCVPFLPVYLLQELKVAERDINFWSGMVYSVTFLGSSVMAPYWGALADKVGQRKMAIRAGIGLALTYFLGGICRDVWQFFAVRALTGVISGFVPASMSLISSTLPENRMGWGMGLMQTALASGTIIGPLLGGYMSSWFGMRTSFYLGSASLLFATLLVIFLVRDLPFPEIKGREEKNNMWSDLRESLRNKELLYIMCMFFVIQTCMMIIQPLVTMYVGTLMGSVNEDTVKISGIIFSLAGIAGIIAAPFWGKKGQRFGYIRIFCLVTFCAGFINLFQIFVSDVRQFAFIQFIYGIFLAGAVPNINADVAKVTGLAARGKAFGLVTSAQQFGGVAGPLLGGFLGNLMSTKYVLFFTGIVHMAVALYSYLTRVKKVRQD